MTVGWGIIGLGRHVDQFMTPALSKATNTKLVAVCSRNIEKAKNFAADHGVESAYDSYEKMLEDPKLDIVYISTPNSLHAEQTIMAAQAGKHVLCEKPMALAVADAERMIRACEENHVKLAVDFQNRFHPAHVEARRLIAEGNVGDIFLAKAQYCRYIAGASFVMPGWRNDPAMVGAGALVGVGVHPIDLLRFLLNSEVEDVIALCEPQTENVLDDMDYIILKFESGTRGIVVSGGKVPHSDNDAILYGMKAKVTCKGTVGMPMQGELVVEGDDIDIHASYPSTDCMPGNYMRLIEHFNNCIVEDIDPISSGYDGLQVLRITNAILESSRTGKATRVT